MILGFPSTDFTGVEPTDGKVIHDICANKFGVSFPLFEIGPVKGADKQELFTFLTQTGPESMQGEVSFNFEKFLINRKGFVRERFGSFSGAQSLVVRRRIEELLNNQ